MVLLHQTSQFPLVDCVVIGNFSLLCLLNNADDCSSILFNQREASDGGVGRKRERVTSGESRMTWIVGLVEVDLRDGDSSRDIVNGTVDVNGRKW